MKRARVIAATCMTAVRIGALKALEHEAGLFTHIVIDEAGHASEPEVLCGMVHLANHGPGKAPPVVVLAGDPKQLGPIVSVPSRTVVCICASIAANPASPLTLLYTAYFFLPSLTPSADLRGASQIHSDKAKAHGLGLSLMSRLMTPARSTSGVSLAPHALDLETFPDSHGYDPRLVRMLVKNYRSHPAIIKLPSKMFYQDALEPFADPVLVE